MKRVLFLFFISIIPFSFTDVKVDPIFSSGMVLQQGIAIPIWGTAESGEKVIVSFRGQRKETTVAEDGKWMVKLDPEKAGEPGTLTVKGKETIVFNDVLLGEVWVGSGQSNMAGTAARYIKGDSVLKSIINDSNPGIRLYSAKDKKWVTADAKSSLAFSALHFSFGYYLHQELKVPVGLMVGAVGGRPSGNFVTKEMLMEDEASIAVFAKEGFTVEDMNKKREEMQPAFQSLMTEWASKYEKVKAAGGDLKAMRKLRPRFKGPIEVGELYKRKILPFVPYGIKGVLWDQGESKTQIKGFNQITLMNALIKGWRKAWNQGDFYFLHVQKPSGAGVAWDDENPVNKGSRKFVNLYPSSHVMTPESLNYPLDHINMRALPNAPLVTAMDLAPGIHPANKSGYGKRAATVALGTAYGKEIITLGPTYKSHKVEDGKLRVEFENTGSGLAFKYADEVRGFEIAGEDGKWEWAEAKIDGNAVILSNSRVKVPVMVQYAFSKTSNFANLFNKEGWPALMFTTKKAVVTPK